MKLAEPISRRWTKVEYLRLADDGWFSEQRVQLVRGEIIQMPPQGNQHQWAIHQMSKFLQSAFGENHWVRVQTPLSIAEDSEPEPDVAVTVDIPAKYKHENPTTALLVVEISDSSVRLDRRKASLYASANIPEYWLVNLSSRKIEVHHNPITDPQQEFGHRYADHFELDENQTISPLAKPDSKISVKTFFE